MPPVHHEQFVRIYVAGMAPHAKEAMNAMQSEIDAGWRIEHVVSVASGMLLVVYGRPRALEARRPFGSLP